MISLMRNPQLPLPKRVRTMTMSDKSGLSPPFTCVYYQGCLHLGSGKDTFAAGGFTKTGRGRE